MTLVNVQEAKAQLSRLLLAAERGEDIVIARNGHPVVRLQPVKTPQERELGFLPMTLPDFFFEPLPNDELVAWEG